MYVYVVAGVRLEFVYEVPEVTVAIGVVLLSLYTLYPVTPTASNDGDHVSAICDGDCDGEDRLVGCVGAWVSGVVVTGEAIENDVL